MVIYVYGEDFYGNYIIVLFVCIELWWEKGIKREESVDIVNCLLLTKNFFYGKMWFVDLFLYLRYNLIVLLNFVSIVFLLGFLFWVCREKGSGE